MTAQAMLLNFLLVLTFLQSSLGSVEHDTNWHKFFANEHHEASLDSIFDARQPTHQTSTKQQVGNRRKIEAKGVGSANREETFPPAGKWQRLRIPDQSHRDSLETKKLVHHYYPEPVPPTSTAGQALAAYERRKKFREEDVSSFVNALHEGRQADAKLMAQESKRRQRNQRSMAKVRADKKEKETAAKSQGSSRKGTAGAP
jgi:hypothetical protein